MKYFFIISLFIFSLSLTAQKSLWTSVDDTQIILPRNSEKKDLPSQYITLELEFEQFQRLLYRANKEFTNQRGIIIDLPLPDGSLAEFEIWESSIMEKGLAERYPTIKTYKGRATNNPSMISRFGYSELGFHAMIQSPEGVILIDPIASHQRQFYTVSYARFNPHNEAMEWTCGVTSNIEASSFMSIEKTQGQRRSKNEPVDLFIYKAAIASTGEYAEFHRAETKEDVLSHIVAIMNQANLVFERDLALRMELIEEIDTLIFLDKDTDPYTNGSNVLQSYQENPAVIERIIDPSTFDIGHVFVAQCGSGVVGIGGGKVCSPSKSLGISCQFSSDTRFAIDIVAHEIGHQLFANHSWNNCPGNEDNFVGGTAYEPGSGSTIMSYAGICGGGNNIQNTADNYYHVTNLQEILNDKLIGRTNSCADIIPTGNIKPEAIINYENGFYIPISTPFELIGDGFDANGDELTYCWEQYDTGPSVDLGSPIGSTPLFRSQPPTLDPKRTFPRQFDLINNRRDIREFLPDYSRNLTFRLTVRDNNLEAGGVDWEQLSFRVTNTAGPFLVEFPNTSQDILNVGEQVEIKWAVANTNQGLINAQKVNILLSLDGGNTFPHTLATNTDNDGSQLVTIPDLQTTEARIRVEAVGNIFFDISNQDFAIAAPERAGFTFIPSFQEQQVCLPATVNIDLATLSLLGYDQPITFSHAISDEGVMVDFQENGINPGANTTFSLSFPADFPSGDFDFDLIGIAEGADTISRQFNLDLVSNQFTDFQLVSPENNTSGVGLPEFDWTTAIDALQYEVEIATNPAFGESIIDLGANLEQPPYTPTNQLEESTIYYWRARPVNECGAGDNSEIFAFQTQNLSCVSQEGTEVPILISGQGLPVIESKMTVFENFLISDLNVPIVRGSHDWVSHIRTSIISPAGTEAVLFAGKCPGSVPFNLGFDDESPNALPCPPVGGGMHTPQAALSIFDGENAFGEWTLRIEVTDGFGEGGSLDEWSLEFCGNISLDPPSLVNNELLSVQTGKGRVIDEAFLLSEDVNNTPDELLYTIVTQPAQGILLMNGEPIGVGMQFTQGDLNNRLLRYRQTSELIEGQDNFSFTVSDGEGGWIGITTFDIVIDPNETITSVGEISLENQISIYPNPAQNQLFITFEEGLTATGQLELFNLNGAMIFQRILPSQRLIPISLVGIENGLYFLKIKTEKGAITKKVIIQKQ